MDYGVLLCCRQKGQCNSGLRLFILTFYTNRNSKIFVSTDAGKAFDITSKNVLLKLKLLIE